MAEPMGQKMVVDIPIGTGAATASLYPGMLWTGRLPAGYVYYLDSAYICPSTTVAAQTTDANQWYLKDEDANTIGSLSTGAALATTGTTFASISSTYREIDASSTAHTFYVTCVQSGNGVVPPYNFIVHTIWSIRRSGSNV